MSSTRFQPLMVVALAALGSTIPASLSAQVSVYDNTAPANNLHAIHATGDEYGDQITLAPGFSREATQFDLIYYSNFNLAAGGVVRLYVNDGAPVSGNPSPGTLLYQSAAFDIVKSDVSDPNNVLGSRVSINLKGSGLILPDNLTWTVSFSGVSGGNEAGVLVFDPPTVGGKYGDDFWKKNGPVWSLQTLANNTPGNFAAQITAIPEPSTYALAAVGAIGWLSLAAYRRSKK